MTRTSLFGAAIAFSIAASSASAARPAFQTLDENRDGIVSRDEYQGTIRDFGIFPKWDRNADGYLSEDEWRASGWDADLSLWDQDRDAVLDEAEFYDGVWGEGDADGDDAWHPGERDAFDDGGLLDDV